MPNIVCAPVKVSNFISLKDTPAAYAGEANKYLHVNAGANAIEFVDRIGLNVALPTDGYIFVQDLAINTADPFYGFRQEYIKTLGASGAADDMYGIYSVFDFDQVGGTIGSMYGAYIEARLDNGDIGIAADDLWGTHIFVDLNGGNAGRDVWGLQVEVGCGGTDVADDLWGLDSWLDLNSGSVAGDILGTSIWIDISAGFDPPGSDVYGFYAYVDVNIAPVGDVFMLYLDEQDGVDWGVYQNGIADNYFGGDVGIGIAPAARLHVAGGDTIFDTDTGTDPVWITRLGGTNQSAKIYVDDAELIVESIQDEAAGAFASMTLRCGSQVGQAPNFVISDYRSGADVEMVHIDIDTGRCGLRQAAPAYRLDVFENRANYMAQFFNDGNNDNRKGVIVQCGADANPSTTFILLKDGNGTNAGWIVGDGAGGVTYSSASDERLKNVLGNVDAPRAIAALKTINPIEYVGKGGGTQKNIGFRAQDIHKLFPEVATHDEEEDQWSIDYGRLTPILWAQNQVLLQRIEKLEQKCGRHSVVH